MVRELLVKFYNKSAKRKPKMIVVYREGVSQGHFQAVREKEIPQVRMVPGIQGQVKQTTSTWCQRLCSPLVWFRWWTHSWTTSLRWLHLHCLKAQGFDAT
jgi:Piwi domain